MIVDERGDYDLKELGAISETKFSMGLLRLVPLGGNRLIEVINCAPNHLSSSGEWR
jgi:hypothetical protein